MEFTFGDAALYHHSLHFTQREEDCSRREMMELQFQGFEFWPIEHPLEPLDEDTPIKCPLPASSPINNDEQGAAEMARESMVRVRMRGAAPVRAMRKRQHTLIGTEQGKARVAPLPPPPPPPPPPSLQPHNNINDFQMLQAFD